MTKKLKTINLELRKERDQVSISFIVKLFDLNL